MKRSAAPRAGSPCEHARTSRAKTAAAPTDRASSFLEQGIESRPRVLGTALAAHVARSGTSRREDEKVAEIRSLLVDDALGIRLPTVVVCPRGVVCTAAA